MFMNNKGTKGGAIYLKETYNTEMSRCLFHDNIASFGGALYLETEVNYLKMDSCEFVANDATVSGGGVYVETLVHYLDIQGSTFLTNM